MASADTSSRDAARLSRQGTVSTIPLASGAIKYGGHDENATLREAGSSSASSSGASGERAGIAGGESSCPVSAAPEHSGEKSGRTADTHWRYPSPQEFHRAMDRKGWNPRAEDMDTIVTIHNMINERAWQEIRQYEALHHTACPCGPALLRFRGRAEDRSPKARVKGWLGAAAPFDRHDWVIDRCGEQVRYVVDFYQGAEPTDARLRELQKRVPLQSVYLDVRPALTMTGFWDRFRMTGAKLLGVPLPDPDQVFDERHHRTLRGPSPHQSTEGAEGSSQTPSEDQRRPHPQAPRVEGGCPVDHGK